MKKVIESIILIFFVSFSTQAAVDYETEIQPIFNNNCAACHIDANYYGNLNLSSYTNLMSGNSDHGPVVTPYDGTNSIIIQKLGPNPPFGNRMPWNAPPLDATTIALISTWIDEGALPEINVSIKQDNWIPDKFTVYQNFPNPFNPVTTLRYFIPERNRVKIVIYDINGKQVKSLVNGFENAGIKTITWDSRDNNGILVATGVYLCRIQAGINTQIIKMVFMK